MEQIKTIGMFTRQLSSGDFVIFLGDWLHAQGKKIDRDVYYLAYAAFEAMAEIAHIIVIPGNHDVYNGRISVLRPLRKLAKVVDRPWKLDIKGDSFYCIPYTEHRQEFIGMMQHLKGEEGVSILCSHIGVMGAKVGLMEYMVREPVLPKDILDHVDLAVLGHYHKHQTVAEFVHYVGSPYQIDFSEMGIEKGYAVWNGNGVDFHELSGPKFWNVNVKSPADLKKFREVCNDGHYYKLVVKTKKVSDKDLQFGTNVIVERDVKKRTLPRVQVEADDVSGLISHYVLNTKTDLDKARLEKQALEIWGKRKEADND